MLSRKLVVKITTSMFAIAVISGVVLSNTILSHNSAEAFFEAGQRSYWPATVEGLSADINPYGLPQSWRFAPDTYKVGETISPTIKVTNTNNDGKTISTPVYLFVSKVIESPIGRNVENPNIEIGDGELNANEQAKNDKQDYKKPIYVGNITLNCGEETLFTHSFSATEPGYYQVDFSTDSNDNGYVSGHIFAAGFIRVLPNATTAVKSTVTPTPTNMSTVAGQSTTPTVSPVTPTPSNQAEIKKVASAAATNEVLGAIALPYTGSTQTNTIITLVVLAGFASLGYAFTTFKKA